MCKTLDLLFKGRGDEDTEKHEEMKGNGEEDEEKKANFQNYLGAKLQYPSLRVSRDQTRPPFQRVLCVTSHTASLDH